MPELTLADVDEIDNRIALSLEPRYRQGLDPIRRRVLMQAADGRLADLMLKHGPALLALAREALERRGGPRVVKRDLLPSNLEDDHA